MQQKYFYEKIFNKIDFTKTPVPKGEYEECTFSNCDFSSADLSEIKFIETEFIDCNLSNAQLYKTAYQEVHFNGCKMLGLQWEACNGFGFAAHFDSCQLNHSSFYKVKLNRSSFVNSKLIGVDFTEADLKGVKLVKCELLNAVFENTILEKADFSGSVNYSIDPEMNKIRGAKFSLPEVVGLLNKYGIKIDCIRRK